MTTLIHEEKEVTTRTMRKMEPPEWLHRPRRLGQRRSSEGTSARLPPAQSPVSAIFFIPLSTSPRYMPPRP